MKMVIETELNFNAPETKAEAFKRVANPRLKKARAAIRSIDSMAGGNYEYTAEDVDKMCNFLVYEVTKLRNVLMLEDNSNDDVL